MSPPLPPRFPLGWGDGVPFFTCDSGGLANFRFDNSAGRYVVLTFLQSASLESSRKVLDAFLAYRDVFDDQHCMWFPVTIDPLDRTTDRLGDRLPGIRTIWDLDQKVSRLFRLVGDASADPRDPATYRRFT